MNDQESLHDKLHYFVNRLSTLEGQLRQLAPALQQLVLLSLAEENLNTAFVHFELGSATSSIQKHLANSLDYFIRGFAYKNTPDTKRYPQGPVKVRDELSNPSRGFRALCLALVLGDKVQAQAIAALIWDPPFASYIGPPPATCGFNEQFIAYAYRDYVLEEAPSDLLVTLSNVQDESFYHSLLKQYLLELIQSQPKKLPELLKSLGQNFAKQIYQPIYNSMDLTSMALAQIGLSRGLIRTEQLPNSPYFSSALLNN